MQEFPLYYKAGDVGQFDLNWWPLREFVPLHLSLDMMTADFDEWARQVNENALLKSKTSRAAPVKQAFLDGVSHFLDE